MSGCWNSWAAKKLEFLPSCLKKKEMNKKIKCVIFDCDGTLVDSETLCALGWSLMLKKHGVEISAKDIQLKYQGRQFAAILHELCNHYQLTPGPEFEPQYRSIVSELFEQQLTAIPGIEIALSAINLPMCVASNGPKHKIEQALRLTGLDGYFENYIFSAYEVGIWKPDPRFLLHVANVMRFPAEDCAMVDDTVVGITSAIESGMMPYLYDRHGEVAISDRYISFSSMVGLADLISS